MTLERRIVTVLFADLVDFTPLSERLDAEDVAAIQDAYFSVVRDTVGRYGGSLEKFIGDAVMAAFGLGQARDNEAEQAVRAGLALIHGIDSLGPRLGLDVGELRIRVGIHTGEAVISAAAPEEGQGTGLGRVTGDTVNVAARLQSVSEPGRVLIGDATALAVAAAIEHEPPRRFELKGKSVPVPASLVVGIRPEPSRELAMGGMTAPTIGRGAELAELIAYEARVRTGSRERLLLIAPPGVGKTRLLGEFAVRIAQTGSDPAPAHWRTRSRQESGLPFSLARELLAAALAEAGLPRLHADGPDDARRDLERVVLAAGESSSRAAVVAGLVATLLGSETHPEAGAADRDALFSAWSVALRAIAGGRAVHWLAEDVHWAGADDFAFIDTLMADAAWRTLLIVATARPSVLERAGTAWSRMDLAPLPATDAGALIGALVGNALPVELADRIVERSDGNPLFIEELLRTWVSVGTLVQDAPGGLWRLTTPATAIPLPTTIQAIYASQLDDLPTDVRQTARRASVAGRRFPIGFLAGLGAGDAAATVGDLMRRAIVAGPQPDTLVGDTYAYRHALVRDASYTSLARAERADLHVRMALWLEQTAGSAAFLLAADIGAHYADALANASAMSATVGPGLTRLDVATRAATWLERAGDRAIETAAYAAARSTLRRAIDLTPTDDAQAMARRLARLGDSFVGTGGLDEAVDAYERASATYRIALTAEAASSHEALISRRALARTVRSLGRARYEQTRFAEALAAATEGLEVVGREDEASRLPLELLSIEARNALTNDSRALLAEAEELRRRAERIDDPEILLDAVRTAVLIRTEAGEGDADDWRSLADRFEVLHRWRDMAGALLTAAALTEDEALYSGLAQTVETLADAHGLTESQAWLAYSRARRAFTVGAWDEAVRHGIEALDRGEAHGYHRVAVRTWFLLGPIASARRDRDLLQRAETWFSARDNERTFPDSPYGRLMHTGIDVDLASVGLRDRTIPDFAWLETAFGLAYDGADWMAATERVVGALLDAGRIDDAQQAIALLDRARAQDPDALGTASLALLRAWIAEAVGDSEAAVRAARTGLRNLAPEGAPWWTYRLLGVLRRLGVATAGDSRRAERCARLLGIESGAPR